MSDIFREVEEDIKRDRLKRLWDRFGVFVIGGAVLIVVAVAAWRAWEWYTAQEAATAGEAYYEALSLAQQGEREAAVQRFSQIAGEGGPFAPLARLRVAAEQAAGGDPEEAIATYDAIAEDGTVDRQLRNLARIRAGYLLVDTAGLDELQDRLGDLAAPEGAWRHSAREILGLAAYREGDLDLAIERFQEILADGDAPDGVRNRAELMISLASADRAPDAAAEPDQQNGAESQ